MQDLRIRITADNRATGPLREVDRALANVGRSAASLGSLMQPLAAAFAGIGAGLGLQQIATSFAEAEARFLKLEQTVKATGNAAGLTAEELRTMARELALSTLESIQGAETAVAQLLTFKAVGKDASLARRATESLVRHMQGLLQSIGVAVTGVGLYTRSGNPHKAALAVSTFQATG